MIDDSGFKRESVRNSPGDRKGVFLTGHGWYVTALQALLAMPLRLLRTITLMRAENAFAASRALRAQGKLDDAEAILNSVRGARFCLAELGLEHAEIASARGQWILARERWQDVIRRYGDKTPANAFVKLSQACRNLGEFDAAEAAVNAGRRMNPDSPKLALEHGEIAYSRRDWPEVVKRWREATDRFDEKVPAGVFLRLSQAYRNLRDLHEAQTTVTVGRTKHPGSIDLAVEEGEIAWLRRDWAEAAKRWQEAVDHFGGELPVSGFIRLSQAYRNVMAISAAETAVSTGQAKYPDSIDLVIERGEIAWACRDWAGALACWEEVVSRIGDAAPPELFHKIGHAYLLKGDLARAQAVVKLLIPSTFPSDHERCEEHFRGAGENPVLRVAIKCAAPNEEQKHVWGDYHFAKSLAEALARLGHVVRVDLRPAWYTQNVVDDVAIVLRGLSAYIPSSNQINVCWLISHPDLVMDRELEYYDHVFVASSSYAETLRNRISAPVDALLQCSDPNVFRPTAIPPSVPVADLLFVGNARGQRRKIVFDAIAKNLPIAVYGQGWNYLIDQSYFRGENIKNDELYHHYGAAKIVLNDHWPDMAAKGFVSNRIFDAALSGAFVISDSFNGSELFEHAIVTYETPEELRDLCDQWMCDDEARRALSSRLHALVLRGHTFDHRAAVLDAVIRSLHRSRDFGPAAHRRSEEL
jgi:lipopolysaccharide biosynthesis regulator YciM